eukprot:790821-Amorphochlora_amoeboformis.AAC.1
MSVLTSRSATTSTATPPQPKNNFGYSHTCHTSTHTCHGALSGHLSRCPVTPPVTVPCHGALSRHLSRCPVIPPSHTLILISTQLPRCLSIDCHTTCHTACHATLSHNPVTLPSHALILIIIPDNSQRTAVH